MARADQVFYATLAQLCDFFAFFEDGQAAAQALGHLPPADLTLSPQMPVFLSRGNGVCPVSHPWISSLRLGVADSKLGDADLNLELLCRLAGRPCVPRVWPLGSSSRARRR